MPDYLCYKDLYTIASTNIRVYFLPFYLHNLFTKLHTINRESLRLIEAYL